VLLRSDRWVRSVGWFRVAFTGEGPRIVASEAEASRRTLIEFVAQLQADHGIMLHAR
jgi:phospholipase/carboxylesterase